MQETTFVRVDSRRRVNLNKWSKGVESYNVEVLSDGCFLLTPKYKELPKIPAEPGNHAK